MDAAELEKFVGDLEIAVDRLRSLYEQYFMGIEKMEPMVPRKDVDRRIQVLRKEQIRNTAQRFRFQMVLQRYNTYQTHWQRICREIENGTYKRHVLRARQRFGDAARPGSLPPPPEPKAAAAPVTPPLARPGAPASGELARELAELEREFAPRGDLGKDDLDVARPAAAPGAARRLGPVWRKAEPVAPRAPSVPPPPPAARAAAAPPPLPPRMPASPPAPRMAAPAVAVPGASPPPRLPSARPAPPAAPAARPPPIPAPASLLPRPAAALSTAGELPDERVRQLYAQYVETKRQQKESTAAITYEGVARSLRDSSAKLRDKHGKSVDFEVSVKDGKTVLKPVLK